MAMELSLAGVEVDVILFAAIQDAPSDARANFEIVAKRASLEAVKRSSRTHTFVV